MKKLLFVSTILIFVSGFVLSDTITITSPTGSSSWETGTGHNITWTKTASLTTNVKIRIFNQAGAQILKITDNTANDGSYNWTVPGSFSPGKYFIRIKTIDNQVYKDSSLFDIVAPSTSTPPPPEPGSLTITNPPEVNPPFKWMHGKTFSIIWQKSNLQSNMVIDLLNVSGNKLKTLYGNVSKTAGSKNWTPPTSILWGFYKIRVFTSDGLVSDISPKFEIVTNPELLYTTAQLHGTITGPATPSRKVRRPGSPFTPKPKPKVMIVKINNIPYSSGMSTPYGSTSSPLKVYFTGLCSSPMDYRVVIEMSNINLGGGLQHMYDSGWKNNGNFNILIPYDKLQDIQSNPNPIWYGGEISLRLKNKSTGQTTLYNCIVKFTW